MDGQVRREAGLFGPWSDERHQRAVQGAGTGRHGDGRPRHWNTAGLYTRGCEYIVPSNTIHYDTGLYGGVV